MPRHPVVREQINFDFIRSLLGAEVRTILEIGAHRGQHSAQFAQTFPEATVHAFEPDPRAILRFCENVQEPRVILHKIAIGAVDGSAPFHVSGGLPPNAPADLLARYYPQGWDQSGSLHAPKTHLQRFPWCRFDATITVTVRSLDSWAQEQGIGAVDFIWADTQGAEGDLIQGGRKTLARTRYFYTEYSNDEIYEGEPNLATLLAMLPEFSVMKRYPNDILLRNEALAKNS